MEYQKRAQLFHLAEFEESFLQPVLDRLNPRLSRERETDNEYPVSELCEGIGWVYLGLDCTYFPESESQLMLQQLGRLLRETYREIAEGVLYRFDVALQRRIQFLIERGPGDYDHRFDSGGNLQSALQTYLLLSTRFTKDEQLRFLSKALGFTAEREWDNYVSADPEPDRVIECLSQAPPESAEPSCLVYSGFVRMQDFIESIREFDSELRADSGIDDSDKSELIRATLELSTWRLDLKHRRVRTRYEDVAKRATFLLARGSSSGFLEKVYVLADYWESRGFQEPLAATV